MTAIGYALSSEEHGAQALVRHAVRAEDAGFTFAVIPDHDDPGLELHGRSPFMWGVLGAIAQATERLRVGTGVTCPPVGTDQPATVAHASATTAALMPGRFFLGLGCGEGLADAVGVIRELWQGAEISHDGRYDRTETPRIHALPDPLPPIYLAADGTGAAAEAARLGDGLIGTAPDRSLLDAYCDAGGSGPRMGQVTVCWAPSEAEGRRTALQWRRRTAAIHFEASKERLSASATEEQVTELVPCGPDPERHAATVRSFVDAGYDQVYLRQIGPDQAGFLKFAEGELLPALRPKALGIAS